MIFEYTQFLHRKSQRVFMKILVTGGAGFIGASSQQANRR